MSSVVLYEIIDNHIALVTINRPNQRNSISPEVAVRLSEIYTDIEHNDHIRVVILTGTGSSFCAGADLGRLITLATGAREAEDQWDVLFMEDSQRILSQALLRDYDIGKPIITALNGHAVAGGLEMVLGSDIRVASKGVKMGLQEAKWGLLPAGGGCVRLPRQIPYSIAMELLVTGRLVTAEYLAVFGFVNYVVEEDQVLEKALEIARLIVENGPVAVKWIRKTVKETNGMDEDVALLVERDNNYKVIMHPDAIEGPRAFKEKRKPMWVTLPKL